ncbi:MAG: hypothetical protein JWR12_782 [Mucilaginibacter sp.]|nr:hypothetical protein [Mucilaginibacter sp.]
MTKNREFFLLAVGVIITRSADVIGTYYYTSNLSAEANPMVSLMKMGWLYLLTIQCVAILISVTSNYYSLFVIKAIEVQNAGLNFQEYLSMLFFNTKDDWKWQYAFIKFPKGKKQNIFLLGWVIPRILIHVGVIIILFFCLLNFVPGYPSIHKYFVIPMYSLILLCIPLNFLKYFKYRYKKYLDKKVEPITT